MILTNCVCMSTALTFAADTCIFLSFTLQLYVLMGHFTSMYLQLTATVIGRRTMFTWILATTWTDHVQNQCIILHVHH